MAERFTESGRGVEQEELMIELDDVLSEIMRRMADIIIQGGNMPQKIIVSDRVYKLLMDITLMPKPVRYEDSTFYIADIPVEKGEIQNKEEELWFKIE